MHCATIAILVDGLHCGEQDDVPYGVAAGEQHGAAVYAYAQATRGGHAVLEGVDVIVVHHAGLVVALGAQLDLLEEALLLVDGVVELAEGVAHLAAADEQLEALGEALVLRAALGKRADVDRVHGDEGRLHDLILDLLVEALVQRVAPGRLLAVHVHARGLRGGHGLGVAVDGHEVHAQVLVDSLGHGHARPAGSQRDVLALPVDLVCAEYLHRSAAEQVFKQVHHVVEVGVGLVQLDGGELGVVTGVHSLVAEDAAELVNALDAADDKALERQLGGYTQIHVHIQRIVVGYKGSRRRAAGDGVQHRRLDFHVSAAFQEAADIAHELGANLKVAAALVAHDEVDVALAVLELDVGHAVELLGQRPEALGQQSDLLRVDAYLAGLGLENIALHADDVADVVAAEVLELLLADGVGADIELELAAVVLDVAEYGLAHAALGHDASGHGDVPVLVLLVAVPYLACPGAALEAGYFKRVASRGAQLLELLAADTENFTELLLRSLVHVVLYVLPAHSAPLSLFVAHRHDGEAHLSGRSLDSDRLTDAVAYYRTADRALVADAPLHGVGLLRADDLILDLIVFVQVAQFDMTAETDGIGVKLGLFDYFGVLDEHLHLGDFGVELALLRLGLVVLAVLAEIAEAAGFLNKLADLFFADGLKVMELLDQIVIALLAHLVLALSSHCYLPSVNCAAPAAPFILIVTP